MATATEVVPIYEGQDFYVPYFEVKIEGRHQAHDVVRDILSVTYKDNIQEMDSFDITINNWDAGNRTFKYSDARLFDPGKTVELWMGYYGKDRLRKMVSGQITSLRPSFPSGGGSTLTISGLNLLYRLRSSQVSDTYENMTDSQIAQKIAQRLGLDFDSEEQGEEKLTYLFQDNQYDIIFLMERARRIGYDLFVEEGNKSGEKATLHFKRSTTVRHQAYRLTYGKSLIEFQPELTTANQVGKVTVRGWNSASKAKIEATVTRQQIETKGVGDRGGQQEVAQSFQDKEEIIATKPVESEAEAKQLARETLEKIAKDMVKGTGSIVGLPDLRAGVVLQIDGLGDRFSGRYFVISTTHAIGDSGYTTQFECRREEL